MLHGWMKKSLDDWMKKMVAWLNEENSFDCWMKHIIRWLDEKT
jgi:hypothetical protein